MRSSIHTATLAMGGHDLCTPPENVPHSSTIDIYPTEVRSGGPDRSPIPKNLSFVMAPSTDPHTFEPHLNVPNR